MTYKDYCEERIENLDISKVVEIFNEYADRNSYERIFPFEEIEINEYLCGLSPWEIFQAGNDAKVDFCEDYFSISGLGYIETLSDSDIVEAVTDDFSEDDYPEEWKEEWLEHLYDILDETFKLWEGREDYFDEFFEDVDVTEIDDDDILGDFEEWMNDNHEGELPE